MKLRLSNRIELLRCTCRGGKVRRTVSLALTLVAFILVASTSVVTAQVQTGNSANAPKIETPKMTRPFYDSEQALEIATRFKEAWQTGSGREDFSPNLIQAIPVWLSEGKPNFPQTAPRILKQSRRAWVYVTPPTKEQLRLVKPDDRPMMEFLQQEDGNWKLVGVSVPGDAFSQLRTTGAERSAVVRLKDIDPNLVAAVVGSIEGYRNAGTAIDRDWFDSQSFTAPDRILHGINDVLSLIHI